MEGLVGVIQGINRGDVVALFEGGSHTSIAGYVCSLTEDKIRLSTEDPFNYDFLKNHPYEKKDTPKSKDYNLRNFSEFKILLRRK